VFGLNIIAAPCCCMGLRRIAPSCAWPRRVPYGRGWPRMAAQGRSRSRQLAQGLAWSPPVSPGCARSLQVAPVLSRLRPFSPGCATSCQVARMPARARAVSRNPSRMPASPFRRSRRSRRCLVSRMCRALVSLGPRLVRGVPGRVVIACGRAVRHVREKAARTCDVRRHAWGRASL